MSKHKNGGVANLIMQEKQLRKKALCVVPSLSAERLFLMLQTKA